MKSVKELIMSVDAKTDEVIINIKKHNEVIDELKQLRVKHEEENVIASLEKEMLPEIMSKMKLQMKESVADALSDY